MRKAVKNGIIGAAAVVALGAGGAAYAGAAGGDGEQVTGTDADRASQAALERVGPGTVTEVERADDGDRGYEVEVDREQGGSVEVNVDEGFAVVGTEADDDGRGDDGSEPDDD
jgi:uncharacterized membrane protein YkoI